MKNAVINQFFVQNLQTKGFNKEKMTALNNAYSDIVL